MISELQLEVHALVEKSKFKKPKNVENILNCNSKFSKAIVVDVKYISKIIL